MKLNLTASTVLALLATSAGCFAQPDSTTGTSTSQIIQEIRQNYKEAKAPPRFIHLAPGAVEPEGWLRDWAEAAADGITGDLGNRHVVFSHGWTGKDFKSKGSAGRGLRWPLEQSAYWLDGLVRLAHILDDAELKKLAHERLDKVVDGVNNGGETFVWWEPKSVIQVDGDEKKLPFDKFTRVFNNWSHAHMGRALVGYYRATGDPDILKALTKVYADFSMPVLPKDEFMPHGAGTNLDAMLATYAMSGDKRVLENALEYVNAKPFQELIHEWATEDLPDGHTVLYYEHARVPALTYPWTGDEEALKASARVLQLGLDHHGLPVGMASGQEWLMGKGAIRGLETCTVAASAYTYKNMLDVTGSRDFADQMEQIILNAGPAAISRDYDTICYFQTMNRVDGVVPIHTIKDIAGYEFSKTAGKTLCCVANSTRMIPDYIETLWLATLDGGLAAGVYGPNTVETAVGDGTPVTIKSETNYPFNSEIAMTVSPQEAVGFPLYLRVPGWCDAPVITVNGEGITAKPDSDGFVKIEREWTKGDKVALKFPMQVEIVRGKTTPVPDIKYFDRPTRSTPITKVTKLGQPYASVHFGPLLFALPMADETPDKAKAGAQWQYALNIEPGQAASEVNVVRSEMPEDFHWQLDSPLKLKVPAVEFDWNPSNTQPLPDEPVKAGEPETITLVPYGTTKFRISMFPISEKMASDTEKSAPDEVTLAR